MKLCESCDGTGLAPITSRRFAFVKDIACRDCEGTGYQK